MKPRLLIIDDDEEIQTQMKWALSPDYEVALAGDQNAGLTMFDAFSPCVTILDMGLPPHPNSSEEGMAVLSALRAVDRNAKIIVISGQNEKEKAIHAVASGAWDYLCKPVDMKELQLLLRRCVYVAELEQEYSEMQRSFQSDSFDGMIGSSKAIKSVFAIIGKVAATHAPVLILGKSGTGKEMAARAIHRRSQSREGPFVAINCNAIPETLMESELFGHEKGAFTGANSQRKGLVESAAGGTLFLDEIGEMPLAIQVKLLRFLQEKTFQRVGGRQEVQSDVRIIAATNAELTDMVSSGTFREDLYFRLAVITIKLPALIERSEDVILLAQHFLERFSKQNGRKGLSFAPDCLKAMLKHAWPGNIRELQNRVQRAVIMSEGKRVSVGDMELSLAANRNDIVTLRTARESMEREMVGAALKRNMGKVSAAALELGISRPTLYEIMEKLGIPKD